MSVRSVVGVAALGSAGAFVVGLLSVGVRSWLRTAPLRHGRIAAGSGPPAGRRASATSPATWIAVGGGAALLLGGLLMAPWAPVPFLAMSLGGAFVATAGSVSRVTRLEVRERGLVIDYARSPPFEVTWSQCRALHPPRTPVGGWRVRAPNGGRSLMPSDLLGREWVLSAVVVRAGLRFDGRTWSRR